mgnify:CR=1 FL=1
MVLQELIGTEATRAIGVGCYERTTTRATERNGSRPKLMTTKGGDARVDIPKLRAGSFFPSILEPRRRIDQALYAVVMEAYVHGLLPLSVNELVTALGRTEISKSEVSRSCAGLDEAISLFRTRRLDSARFPHVYLDATYLHTYVCRGGNGRVQGRVIATGLPERGRREVLDVDVRDSEDELFWRRLGTGLRERGLFGVALVISGRYVGLVAALRRVFLGAGHQRCRVYFIRNVLAHVRKSETEMAAAIFRTIFS